MSDPAQGTPPLPEQPGNGTLPAEQAPQQTGQPSPAAPAPPTVEALTQQLEAERQQRQHFERQYQEILPEFTRKSQALAQLAGAHPQANQPPPDPLAPFVNELRQQGFDEKSSRAVVDIANRMMQPLQQQMQQTYQVNQQTAQVDYMLGQTAQAAPLLFKTQAAYDQVRQTALQVVQNGGQLNRELLEDIAAVADYRAQKGSPPPANGFSQNALPPQIFAGGMNRPGAGFGQHQQPVPQKAPLSAEAIELQATINKRLGKP